MKQPRGTTFNIHPGTYAKWVGAGPRDVRDHAAMLASEVEAEGRPPLTLARILGMIEDIKSRRLRQPEEAK